MKNNVSRRSYGQYIAIVYGEIRRSSSSRRDTSFFILAPRYVILPLSRPYVLWVQELVHDFQRYLRLKLLDFFLKIAILLSTRKFYFRPANFTFDPQILLLTRKFYFGLANQICRKYICHYRPNFWGRKVAILVGCGIIVYCVPRVQSGPF